jgi:hypothetical protein
MHVDGYNIISYNSYYYIIEITREKTMNVPLNHWKRPLICALPVLLLLAASCKAGADAPVIVTYSAPGTTTAASPDIVPFIPPAYYQCAEVLPMDIERSFYSEYGNTAGASAVYGGAVFVFKNLLVDTYMTREVNKGWLWADLTLCPIVNLDAAKKLVSGDRVDIVGICVGRDTTISPGLVFKDCYVLPTGSIQLPAPGGGMTFTSSY